MTEVKFNESNIDHHVFSILTKITSKIYICRHSPEYMRAGGAMYIL